MIQSVKISSKCPLVTIFLCLFKGHSHGGGGHGHGHSHGKGDHEEEEELSNQKENESLVENKDSSSLHKASTSSGSETGLDEVAIEFDEHKVCKFCRIPYVFQYPRFLHQ